MWLKCLQVAVLAGSDVAKANLFVNVLIRRGNGASVVGCTGRTLLVVPDVASSSVTCRQVPRYIVSSIHHLYVLPHSQTSG